MDVPAEGIADIDMGHAASIQVGYNQPPAWKNSGAHGGKALRLVPETGIEPVRPLFRKAADFKSAVSTYFTTQAVLYCGKYSGADDLLRQINTLPHIGRQHEFASLVINVDR